MNSIPSSQSNTFHCIYVVVQFFRGWNFIFLCLKLIIIHYQTPKQRKIKFKPRKKLNHNIYNSHIISSINLSPEMLMLYAVLRMNLIKFNHLCSCYVRYRVFSLTWPASTQIYWNKRKRLHKKRVQLPQDWFGTPTWSPFHCFGTPIWPPWRHVKKLYLNQFKTANWFESTQLFFIPGSAGNNSIDSDAELHWWTAIVFATIRMSIFEQHIAVLRYYDFSSTFRSYCL